MTDAPPDPAPPPSDPPKGQRRRRGGTGATPFGPLKSTARAALLELLDAAAAEAGQGEEARVSPQPMAPPPARIKSNASSSGALHATASASSLASLSSGEAYATSSQASRTVGELRPRPALLIEHGTTIAVSARRMASANVDVALIVLDGALRGILTDTDIARKVIAAGLDPHGTRVEAVMTADPKGVAQESTAAAALCTMIEGRFRHLPVVSAKDEYAVVGVLDVAKCLHDAIVRIDSVQLGESVRLSSLLPTPPPIATAGSRTASKAAISATATVRQAASTMAHRPGGLLVEAEGNPCVGIITPKDLLFRVVAAGLPAGSTLVSAVMTPQPDTMLPSASVLDALRQLQGSGYRNVPVVSSLGEPFGVLDILSLVKGALLQPSHPPSLSDFGKARSVDLASSYEGSEWGWGRAHGASTAGSVADDAEGLPLAALAAPGDAAARQSEQLTQLQQAVANSDAKRERQIGELAEQLARVAAAAEERQKELMRTQKVTAVFAIAASVLAAGSCFTSFLVLLLRRRR